MKREAIKVGTVYVGKCGKRYRMLERFDIFGRCRVLCVKRYSSGKLNLDGAGASAAISVESMCRWAHRDATNDEAAAVLAVLRDARL